MNKGVYSVKQVSTLNVYWVEIVCILKIQLQKRSILAWLLARPAICF